MTTATKKYFYGLMDIDYTETPYGHKLPSCRSLRLAIEAIPEDDRDAWYLPNSESSWAYRNGKIAYLFADEDGDTGCGEPICGECAERAILSGRHDNEYLYASIYSSEEENFCDCGNPVTN